MLQKSKYKFSLYTIVFILFLISIILPLLDSFGTLFFDGSLYENLRLLDKDLFLLLMKSFLLSGIVAFLATIIGIIIGFLLYKTKIRYRNLFKILILIPLIISPYILAVAWKDFNFLLFYSTKLHSPELALILVHIQIFSPLSVLIVGGAFTNINRQIEESALTITKPANVFFKILLPLIKPAIISSFVLIFIFSISEFSVPGYYGVRVFTTEIFTQFSAFYNHSLAMLQSMLLVIICILLLLTEKKYIENSTFLSIGTRGTDTRVYQSKKLNGFGFVLLLLVVIFTIVIPVLVLVFQAFKGDNFIKAFDLILPTIGNSIFLAIIGAFFTLIIGFITAYSSEIFGKTRMVTLLLIIFAVPSIVFGISLIKFYNKPVFNFIYSGLGIIVIGYIGKFSFISYGIIANALKQIPKSLDEAAKIQGIGILKRLKSISLPLLFPSIFASFVINFLFCLGDLGTTIMVYPPGTEIMPIKVFTIMANAPQSLTSSMVLIVFLITMLLISVLFFTFRKIIEKYNVNY